MSAAKKKPTNPAERRRIRQMIYRQNVTNFSLFPTVNGVQFKPSGTGERKEYFRKFVYKYFSKEHNPDNADIETLDGLYGVETRFTKLSDGFKALELFSKTSYGSSVVKEMVDNPKKYVGFELKEAAGEHASAAGVSNGLVLPRRFPSKTHFTYGGQKISKLAIIYHEFSHTAVFRSKQQLAREIGIQDERDAVIRFENPVRLMQGHEPRYTYNRSDGIHKIETINIITGEVRSGIWGVDQLDPRKLVQSCDEDYLP